MTFTLPTYREPDFRHPSLAGAPAARTAPAPAVGVAPDGYHATSNHPEYVRIPGTPYSFRCEADRGQGFTQ
jgi:hypothetical protein